MSGSVSYHAGLSAEDQVTRHYARDGHVILARRWRGPAGEIDLVAEKDGTVVFIEVKKSRSHARAAERLSQRQLHRIYCSAEDFIGHLPAGPIPIAGWMWRCWTGRGRSTFCRMSCVHEGTLTALHLSLSRVMNAHHPGMEMPHAAESCHPDGPDRSHRYRR